MGEWLAEMKKKCREKEAPLQTWACPSVYPAFYKRDFLVILKTSSTHDNLKNSMDLADSKSKRIKMDQEGSIAKL